MEGKRSEIGRFAYMPFGIGSRTCIGAAFALQEATIILAMLMHHFDLDLLPGAEVWPIQRVTCGRARCRCGYPRVMRYVA